MSNKIEIVLPKMGESVTEATITNWLKNPGENVSLDEPLVEVATDKVDNELPSEAEGILIKQLFEKDQVAQVGDVIAIISTDGDAPVSEDNNNTQSQVIVEENTTSENDTSEPKIEINIPSNGNESIKISIRFLSNEIRSDALDIKVFNKKCLAQSNCVISEKTGSIVSELKEKILRTAALYEIENKEKPKKNKK